MPDNIYMPRVQAMVEAVRFSDTDTDTAADAMGVIITGPGPVFYFHIPKSGQSGSVVNGEWICRKLATGQLFVQSDPDFTRTYRSNDQDLN